MLAAELAEENGEVSELDPPNNIASRPPTIGDGYPYLPNNQIGFDHFNQNLNHMGDNELTDYTNRVEDDHRVGMQIHNNQPTHGYMDADEVQGEAQPAASGYGQPMAWDQDFVDMLNYDPSMFDNLNMPPLSDHSVRRVLGNDFSNQTHDQSQPDNGISHQPNLGQQSNFDNLDGQVHANYAQGPLAFTSHPPVNYPTNHNSHNQNQNLQNTSQNQNSNATMLGSYCPMPLNNETSSQHPNNGEEDPNPRDNRNTFASQMRRIAGGPLNATFNAPQPLKVLNGTFIPGFPGILRGDNDEPVTGRFNVKSADKRARETQSPTPKSTSGKRQRRSNENHGIRRQDRTSKTDSERRTNFAGRGNRKLDFGNPVDGLNITGNTTTALAGRSDPGRSLSDTVDESDESDRSYLGVSTTKDTNSSDRYNYQPSPTHKPKRITKSNSNGNPYKVNMNGRDLMGNDGHLTMNEKDSSRVRESKVPLKNQNAQRGNDLQLQQPRRPRTMNSGRIMHMASGSLGNGPQPINEPQLQRPGQLVPMDSRRSMSIASGSLGSGQQLRRELPLHGSRRQGTMNSDRSMSMSSGGFGNGQQPFEPPRNMPVINQRVTSAQNNMNQRPNHNFGRQQSMNSFPENPPQQMADRGFGDQSMANPGWGYNGMPSMQNHQFPMFNPHQNPYPGSFGPFGPVGNMQGNWGCPPGMMMVPLFNQFPPQMNYGGVHPSQLNFGMPTPQMQMMNGAPYQNNTRLAFNGGNQTLAPSLPVRVMSGSQYQNNTGHASNGGSQALGPSPQYGFHTVDPARYIDQRHVPNDPFTDGWSPNHHARAQAESEARNSMGGHRTSEAALALVHLQRGMAEENAIRYPTAPPLNTANGGSLAESPNDPLLIGTTSSDVIQPHPSRTPAASASLEAILATRSASRDTQGQGQATQQLAQPSALTTQYSEEDGEFELEENYGESYAFQS